MNLAPNKLPSTMRAIAISQPGGPEVLRETTRPVPTPAPGEILLQVAVAGVNRPDISQREGRYPPPPGASDLPGLEVCGHVVGMGASLDAGASRFKLGDRVVALVHGGGYAEYVTVPERIALPAPKCLSDLEAAALPETVFTVWSNVFERGGLQPGETLLVHGGSSGIGTTAIMLAKALGAKVIVTAGSPEKCAACVKLGADVAINYAQEDFVARTKAETEGRGADVILDMVAGPYVQRNYEAAAMDGRIVQIATLQGSKIKELNILPLMTKRLTHTGSTLRPRTVAQKAAIADALFAHVWPLIEAGKVRPLIDSVFPLAEAAKAHARMESSAHIGKIMLQVI